MLLIHSRPPLILFYLYIFPWVLGIFSKNICGKFLPFYYFQNFSQTNNICEWCTVIILFIYFMVQFIHDIWVSQTRSPWSRLSFEFDLTDISTQVDLRPSPLTSRLLRRHWNILVDISNKYSFKWLLIIYTCNIEIVDTIFCVKCCITSDSQEVIK